MKLKKEISKKNDVDHVKRDAKKKIPKQNSKDKLEKKNFANKKKMKKNLKVKSEKKTKVVVNLTKCSQNWKNLSNQLPKTPEYKRKKTLDKEKSALAKNDIEIQKVDQKLENNDKEIWFEVDNVFLAEKKELTSNLSTNRVFDAKITKIIGLDCEMVGVGENGEDSILARISIVNQFGECFYDKYVIPTERVTDYRTNVSGIRPDDLKKENNAIEFHLVQKEVAEIIKDRVIVGHAIHNDLQVLFLSHPKKKIRDTQKCKVFRRISPSLGGLSSLKNLAKQILGITIQEGEHNSILDAQVAMKLYTTYKKEWEIDIKEKKSNDKQKSSEKPSALIHNGDLIATDINIKTGNEAHKRYLINKLKKRNNFAKKFLNKK